MSRMRTENQVVADSESLSDNAYNRHAYDLTWARVFRFTAPTLGLVAVLGVLIAVTLGAGCASKKTDLTDSTTNLPDSAGPRASTLDVGPAPAASTSAYIPPAQTPAYVPPTQAAYVPPTYTAPDPVTTQTPTQIASAGANVGLSGAGSTNYTVQKGDTLFRIAKEHYGDGKQWTRITAANPGLSPTTLKAGQKIVLP